MGNMKNVLIKAAAVPAAAAFVLAGSGVAAALPVDIEVPDASVHAEAVSDIKADIADAKADAQAKVDTKVDDIKDGIEAKTDGIVDAKAAIADKVDDAQDAAADAAADAHANVAAAIDGVDGGLHFGGAAGIGAHGGLLIDVKGGLFLGGLLGFAIHGLEHGHGHEPAPCKPVHVVTEAKAKDTTVVYTSASKSLPQTGVPAAALAGAGIATIAAGAGVTFLARRREA